VGLPLAAISVAGVAFAAWTTSGSGVGSAASRAAQNVSFAAGTVTDTLYPGGTGDAAVSVTNPNAYTVTLTSITLNHVYDAATYVSDINPGADIQATCGLSLQTPLSAPTVANGTHPVVLDIDMSNAVSNVASTCANKTFVLDLSASASS
jgi:hypothetical protein